MTIAINPLLANPVILMAVIAGQNPDYAEPFYEEPIITPMPHHSAPNHDAINKYIAPQGTDRDAFFDTEDTHGPRPVISFDEHIVKIAEAYEDAEWTSEEVGIPKPAVTDQHLIEQATRDLDAIFGKQATPKPQPPKTQATPATIKTKKKFVPPQHLTQRIGDSFPAELSLMFR